MRTGSPQSKSRLRHWPRISARLVSAEHVEVISRLSAPWHVSSRQFPLICTDEWNGTRARRTRASVSHLLAFAEKAGARLNGSEILRLKLYSLSISSILLYKSVVERFQLADETLFERLLNDDQHVLNSLLPPRTEYSHNLRRRRHDYELIPKTRTLNINNFIIRMLYKNSY